MRFLATAALALVLVTSCRQETASAPVRAAEPVPRPRTYQRIDVVSIGDSLAKGTGDEKGEGLSGRLKSELEQRGIPSVASVNLGVNGARTADVIASLRDEKVRKTIASADAIVLSVGANDLTETATIPNVPLRTLLDAADTILDHIAQIVETIHDINPRGRILILGAYNPIPNRPEGRLVAQYLDIWDTALTRRFQDDVLVDVVRMSDIVVPQRLSRLDHFHPGGEAYEAAAKRIAAILLQPEQEASSPPRTRFALRES